MLAEEVARLPEPFRATILLCFYEGRTPSEIAHDTGTPAGTVRWRLHEGLKLLRAKLDARHGDRKSWMAMLVPIARPSALASGSAAAVLGGNTLMNLSTKIGIAMGLAFLLVGVASWRASWLDGSHIVHTASIDTGASRTSATALEAAQPAADEPDQRVALNTTSSPKMVVSGTVIDLPYPALGLIEKPGAGLVLNCIRNMGDGKPHVFRQTTDAGGRFEFEWEPAGDREFAPRLSIDADAEYREAGHFVNDAGPGKRIAGFRLERAAHGNLEGTTVDDTGAALEAVELRFFHKDSESASVSEEHVVSDEKGRFHIERFHESVNTPIATKDGYRCVAPPWLTAKPEGGWEPLRIALTPATGRISLVVLGEDGEPKAGVLARLEVARTEPEARHGPELGFFGDSRKRADSLASDAQGRIEFANVWLNSKLSIALLDGKRKLQTDRVFGADLIFVGREGDPIVVTQGPLQLRARLSDRIRLRGQVVHADGTPVGKPHLEVHAVDQPSSWDTGLDASLIGDEQGRFLHAMDPTELPTRVRVSATNGPLKAVTGLGYTGGEEDPTKTWTATYGEAASEVLTLARSDLSSEIPIRLVLQPTSVIAGRARDARGAKGGVRATAVPSGTSNRLAPLQARSSDIADDGRFRIAGLQDGVYDLLIDLEQNSSFTSTTVRGGTPGFGLSVSPLAPLRFSGIRAGTEDLDLRVGTPATAEVTVEARLRTGKADSIFVLLGSISPHDPHSERFLEPPSDSSFSDHAGWPTPKHFSGGSVERNPIADESFVLIAQPGASYSWPPLAEGLYWIGLRSRQDGDKAWSYTEGTGFVYLRPGKYHFVFDTVPTATVEGRLRMLELDRSLCVALADETGRLLRANADNASVDCIFPTGADGSFLITEAPVGRFTLRVGHEDELRAGRYRTEHAIVIDVP
jgi:Sigma-70, region 4